MKELKLHIALPSDSNNHLSHEVEKSFTNAKRAFFNNFSENELSLLFDWQTEDATKDDIESILRKMFVKRLENNISKSEYKQFIPQCYIEKNQRLTSSVRRIALKDFLSGKTLEFTLEAYDYILEECEDYVWLVADIFNDYIILSMDYMLSIKMLLRIKNTLYFEKGVPGEKEFTERLELLTKELQV